jgi:hypothetical protein
MRRGAKARRRLQAVEDASPKRDLFVARISEPPRRNVERHHVAGVHAEVEVTQVVQRSHQHALPQLRLVFGTGAVPERAEQNPDEPVAEHRGVNVHAKQSVDGRDRRQLERLCRYITRPPVAQDRLERLPDGRLELRLKHPWRDGTCAIVLEPDDLLVRLVAAVPPPRWHLLRYFGVLSSHSRLRKEVVPRPPRDPTASAPPAAPGDQLELALDAESEEPAPRKRWAWLLKHVFAADLDTCPRCGGAMRWVEAAATAEAARDLLARLGLAPRPPPAPKSPPFGQLALPFTQ